MSAIIFALLGSIALIAGVVALLRLSARLTVVEWRGPAGHPRHAPRPGPAALARMRAGLAARARQAGGPL